MRCCRVALSLLVLLGGLSAVLGPADGRAGVVTNDGLLPSDECTTTFRIAEYRGGNLATTHSALPNNPDIGGYLYGNGDDAEYDQADIDVAGDEQPMTADASLEDQYAEEDQAEYDQEEPTTEEMTTEEAEADETSDAAYQEGARSEEEYSNDGYGDNGEFGNGPYISAETYGNGQLYGNDDERDTSDMYADDDDSDSEMYADDEDSDSDMYGSDEVYDDSEMNDDEDNDSEMYGSDEGYDDSEMNDDEDNDSEMYGNDEVYDDSEMNDDEDNGSEMYGSGDQYGNGRSYGDDAEYGRGEQNRENMGDEYDNADERGADNSDQFSSFSFAGSGEPTLAPPEPTSAAEGDGTNHSQDSPCYGHPDDEEDAVYGTTDGQNADFEEPADDESGAAVEDETADGFASTPSLSSLLEQALLERAKSWAEDSLSAAGSAIRDLSQRLTASDTATFSSAAEEQEEQDSASYAGAYSDQPEF